MFKVGKNQTFHKMWQTTYVASTIRVFFEHEQANPNVKRMRVSFLRLLFSIQHSL